MRQRAPARTRWRFHCGVAHARCGERVGTGGRRPWCVGNGVGMPQSRVACGRPWVRKSPPAVDYLGWRFRPGRRWSDSGLPEGAGAGEPGRAQMLVDREKFIGQHREQAFAAAQGRYQPTGDPNAFIPFRTASCLAALKSSRSTSGPSWPAARRCMTSSGWTRPPANLWNSRSPRTCSRPRPEHQRSQGAAGDGGAAGQAAVRGRAEAARQAPGQRPAHEGGARQAALGGQATRPSIPRMVPAACVWRPRAARPPSRSRLRRTRILPAT